ncbi:RNA polymerase sigma-70 factor [Flavobacterium sp. ASW18X]|uniref:RNA polymerase sigma-70 factor n=1 Tax=Flavobacterium sp. ASW18X TaxID=2572595 RepID=UPI0010AE7A23|nr:RNA polymerase sigma-70 factor [Flavobacterium sp. ASW18X]TKD57939.1 RNA polymerase sigma-70 factor [Flavobacterium sp. ASW18X]
MTAPDLELFQLIKKDNQLAFRQLYDRHWKKQFYFAVGFLKDETLAKDVVQEVFCILWEKRDHLNIQHFGSYLHSITRNKCLEHLKKSVVFKDVLLHMDALNAENTTEQHIHYLETKEKIEKEINSLPNKTKQIFRLSRHQELSHKEIAKKMNVSTKTVEYHISQSIKKLSASMASFLFFI